MVWCAVWWCGCGGVGVRALVSSGGGCAVVYGNTCAHSVRTVCVQCVVVVTGIVGGGGIGIRVGVRVGVRVGEVGWFCAVEEA